MPRLTEITTYDDVMREYRKFKRSFTPPERALGSPWRGEPAPVAHALLRLDD